MRNLDTNIFLRAVMQPTTEADRSRYQMATDLFRRIANAVEEAAAPESVIHELFYVLCAKTHYGVSHAEAVRLALPLLQLPSLHLARKPEILAAVRMFEQNAGLDFADCLLAIYSEQDGLELTTFDRGLARAAGVTVYSG